MTDYIIGCDNIVGKEKSYQSKVAKVFDQYSDFLSLEDDLFVTGRYGNDAQTHINQLTYNIFNGNGFSVLLKN